MLAKACYKNTIPPALKLTHLLMIRRYFSRVAKTPSNKLYVGLRQIIIRLCTGKQGHWVSGNLSMSWQPSL